MLWLKQAVWGCVFVAAASAAVRAEEEKKAEAAPAAPATATADDIAGWIKQLDADKFADRQAASEKLYGAGKAAIPALTEAATGDSLEVTVRTIDLLQRFFDGEDKSLKEAAKEGLEKIAKSDKSNAARRANEVLKPIEALQPQGQMGRVQFHAMNRGMKNVSVRETNGVKVIKAEEGDRKIEITKKVDGSILMEIAEKANGKDVTKKYTAKDADDLKKQSAEAFKTYQQYAEYKNPLGAGMLRLNVAGGRLMPGAMPAMPPQLQFQALPGVVGPVGGMPGAMVLTNSLAIWNESLKSMSKDLEAGKLSPEEKKEMRLRITELKKQLDKLERQLQKPAEKLEK
jgi:hypothetical protein